MQNSCSLWCFNQPASATFHPFYSTVREIFCALENFHFLVLVLLLTLLALSIVLFERSNHPSTLQDRPSSPDGWLQTCWKVFPTTARRDSHFSYPPSTGKEIKLAKLKWLQKKVQTRRAKFLFYHSDMKINVFALSHPLTRLESCVAVAYRPWLVLRAVDFSFLSSWEKVSSKPFVVPCTGVELTRHPTVDGVVVFPVLRPGGKGFTIIVSHYCFAIHTVQKLIHK